MSFKDKKKDQVTIANVKLDMEFEPMDAKTQFQRAENARILADQIYENTEEIVQKRFAIETQIKSIENKTLLKKQELKSLEEQLSVQIMYLQ